MLSCLCDREANLLLRAPPLALRATGISTFNIQLFVVSIDTIGILLTPVTSKIFLYPWAILNCIIQSENGAVLAFLIQFLHCFWELVFGAVQALERLGIRALRALQFTLKLMKRHTW